MILIAERQYMIFILKSYKDNNMPADALATLGASASAGIVLTYTAGLLRLQHQKDWQYLIMST